MQIHIKIGREIQIPTKIKSWKQTRINIDIGSGYNNKLDADPHPNGVNTVFTV